MRVCILFQILYRFRLLQMRVYFPVLFGRSLFGCFMYGSVCASTRNSWFTPLLPLPRVLCFVNKFISSYLTRGCTVSWMMSCRFSLTLTVRLFLTSSSGELWFPHEPSAASEGSEVQHAQQRAGDHCHRGTLGVKVSLGICVFLKNLIQSCRLMHLPSPLGNCCHTINLPAEVLDFCSMSITHPVHFFSKLAYLLF